MFLDRVDQFAVGRVGHRRPLYPLLAGLSVAGCAGPLSVVDPAGPHAAAVTQLWWVMLAGAGVLAALVFVLLIAAFRRRAGGATPGVRLWIGWLGLAMPAVVLGALLGYALWLGPRTLPAPPGQAIRIGVEARRYSWTFRYPGGMATDTVLHLPADRPVDLSITAEDVIHSFWIPRLAGKMDAIPGQTNRLRIVASRPGRYAGACAEYCGVGHKDHGFTVIVHDAAGWAAFAGGGR